VLLPHDLDNLKYMLLDTTALKNAIAQLEEALAYHESDIALADARLALHLRAAAIQAFEFTYELSTKMLRRYLMEDDASPSTVADMTFSELIRYGYARGLLQAELVEWKQFREDRGATSHVYDAVKAQFVFESIPAFLVEAKFLLHQIKTRQGL
jgi:nucleotidyltransferase substrate binding protein (TIGR01987 family)